MKVVDDSNILMSEKQRSVLLCYEVGKHF